jgi:hypothetical protein
VLEYPKPNGHFTAMQGSSLSSTLTNVKCGRANADSLLLRARLCRRSSLSSTLANVESGQANADSLL